MDGWGWRLVKGGRHEGLNNISFVCHPMMHQVAYDLYFASRILVLDTMAGNE
jgi:hypothetical protein